MGTVTDFILRGSKITADGDYSHEIERCLLLVRKAMTNLDSLLKSRDISLPTPDLENQIIPEIKRCLLLGRKAMTNLDSILKAETSLY